MKISIKLFLFLLLPLLSFANNITIDFVESKYIEALKTKVTKNGQISFLQDSVKIYYAPPYEKTISLNKNEIMISTAKERVVKTTAQEPNIAIMLTLFRALFNKDFATIEQFFKVTKIFKNQVTLTPLSSIGMISKIIYNLEDDDIKKIEIVGQDETRITIEVVGKK